MPPDDTDNWWFYEALKSGLAENAIESAERTGGVGTHWDECWRSADHHACAVARCERLELERAHARRWARLWKKFARKMWRQNRALTRK